MTENQELIFALDIGTRSVIGVVGYAEKSGLHVLAIERQDHGTRAMVDGQIQDIGLVASAAAAVRERLEKKVGKPLRAVCVAAAGRSLKTQRAEYEIMLPDSQSIDSDLIARLETGAINRAEQVFDENGDESDRLYYLVGYSVTGYELDHYPMSTLLDHHGQQLKASVIATFLPSEVVESLCTAMRKAGLEVASLTLEPIAAMNLIIPSQLRLLNLALVDIGAGTSDIAVSQDGTVVGYTMATVAGDEITETLMKQYLLDFDTAEQVKLAISAGEEVTFCDILGVEHCISSEEVAQATEQAARVLSREICAGVRSLNGKAPSALFLVGGGSQLAKLREYVEQEMEMEPSRVAVGSANLRNLVWTEEEYDLKSPDLATPLGIALSAAQQLTGSGLQILINGRRANLFRSERLSVRDVLMMNGYRYRDFIGRTGRSVAFTLDGERRVIRGTQSIPAELMRNGEAANLSDFVHAGDNISFVPAVAGQDAVVALRDLIPELSNEIVWVEDKQMYIGLVARVNGEFVPNDTVLVSGDEVETYRVQTLDDLVSVYHMQTPVMRNGKICSGEMLLEPEDHIVCGEIAKSGEILEENGQEIGTNGNQNSSKEVQGEQSAEQVGASAVQQAETNPQTLHVVLNDKPLELPITAQHPVYYLMDLLEHTDIDFQNLTREVCLEINGQEASFQQRLCMGDHVHIYERPRETEF